MRTEQEITAVFAAVRDKLGQVDETDMDLDYDEMNIVAGVLAWVCGYEKPDIATAVGIWLQKAGHRNGGGEDIP